MNNFDSKINYAKFYEQSESWGKDLDEIQKERALVTQSFVPEDVDTILDIGCGDGRITNELSLKYNITSMDINYEALKYVNKSKIIASIEQIPFHNNSFDLVLSTEVIEHLPDHLFRRAIIDIERVSKRYIVISVPYKENLYASMTRCNICGKVFHEYMHFQSFTRKRLESIFPSFRIIQSFIFGPREKYDNNFLLFIVRRIGRKWLTSQMALCPWCGSKDLGNNQGNLISRIAEYLNWRICHRLSFHKRWIIVLYERVSSK